MKFQWVGGRALHYPASNNSQMVPVVKRMDPGARPLLHLSDQQVTFPHESPFRVNPTSLGHAIKQTNMAAMQAITRSVGLTV